MTTGGHRHGGNPRRDLQRFGLTERPIRDFSANLSPLGPPAAVRRLWPELLQEIADYPSLDGDGVRTFYAQRFGLAASRVLPGNGATELIYLLPRALGLRRVAVLRPAYNDYQRACRLAGAEVVPLDLRSEDAFQALPEATLDTAAQDVDGVFLGHPNNPTGTLFDVGILRRLAHRHPHVAWMVDESFIQLADNFPDISLAFGGPMPSNILVVHSLTKVYALAGLRLGAVIAVPETISKLHRHKEPWTVNGVADRVARELAHCADYEDRLRQLVAVQRHVLADGLQRIGGFEVVEPTVNFMLARWTGGALDDLLRGMMERGFCLRDCRNFVGLEQDYVRLAVRDADANGALLRAFEDLVGMRGEVP